MKPRIQTFFILLFLLNLNPFLASSQEKQGANWFFGGIWNPSNPIYQVPGNHLDFNPSNPHLLPFYYDYNFPSGVATISDKNGQLLFFSSAGNVATRQKINNVYQRMPNGQIFNNFYVNGITSELIIQDPADLDSYYIFFITGPYYFAYYHDLYYAKVNMRLNNGYGDVVPNSLRLINRNVASGMGAMMHANYTDTWLLSYNVNGDTLRSYHISPSGIAPPVVTVINKPLAYYCRMKSSPNSEMFVATNTQDELEVLSFNRTTGVISPLYSLTVPNSSGRKPVSFAFSPNNLKLYVGSEDIMSPIPQGTPYITQFNLASGNLIQIQQSAFPIFYKSNTLQFGGDQYQIRDMQLAIDGRIYITKRSGMDSVDFLSRINYPDQLGANCGFEKNAFRLPSSYYTSALPALNQTIFRNAGILQAQAFKDTICLGDSVQLSAFGAGAEHFQWQPANGLISPSDTLANPFVKPTQTTTYTVTGSSPAGTKTASVTVVVLPKPAVSLSGSGSVCPQVQSVWYKANNPQKQQITWGVKGGSIATASRDSISVNWGNASNTAMVWALPRNILGCLGDTVFFPVTINVILATETPEGADALCLASAKNIVYQIPKTTGSVYTWGIKGGSIQNGQGTATVKVNWNQAGIGKLWVQEESQTSTSLCRGLSDTLKVVIHSSPTTALEIIGPKQVFTFAENQVYSIQNSDPNSTYSWQISGGEITAGQGTRQITVNWDKAGMGILEATETNQNNCAGNKTTYSVEISGKPLPLFYNIITPNNDQKNDAFVIGNLKWYAENELVIYNRWGMEIFRKSNYQNNWRAENLSSGVYYYYFKTNGNSWKGWLEIVK